MSLTGVLASAETSQAPKLLALTRPEAKAPPALGVFWTRLMMPPPPPRPKIRA